MSRLHNWRWRRTHILYGDQAMFVRRGVFEARDRLSEADLEDVKPSERLHTRALTVLPPLTVITDACKFLAHGVIRSMARILLILWCHRYRLQLAGRRFFDPVR